MKEIQRSQLRNDLPVLSLGDTVCVGVLIQEGNKQRVQTYQGILIRQHRSSRVRTITVRRIFQGIGVERIFLLHSPIIQFVEVRRCAKIRRAKLYYLRKAKGKERRLRERFEKKSDYNIHKYKIFQFKSNEL
jgi:large subunit ribosomal protein L19